MCSQQLLDDPAVLRGRTERSGFAWLFVEALHWCRLRLFGDRIRRGQSSDPDSASTWQRRNELQEQRQEQLGVVHQFGHHDRFPYRDKSISRSP